MGNERALTVGGWWMAWPGHQKDRDRSQNGGKNGREHQTFRYIYGYIQKAGGHAEDSQKLGAGPDNTMFVPRPKRRSKPAVAI